MMVLASPAWAFEISRSIVRTMLHFKAVDRVRATYTCGQ